jgi:hypothetical protein
MNDEELATGLRSIAATATIPSGATAQIQRGVQRCRRRHQMRIAAGGVFVLAGAGAITTNHLNTTPPVQTRSSNAKASSPTTPGAIGPTQESVARPVTPGQLRRVGVIARVTSEQPALSRAEAIAAAVSEAGQEKGTPVAELYQVTTLTMGRELEPDPAKPPRVKPAFENRLIWIVTFPPRPTMAFGPGPHNSNSPSVPLNALSTLVHFIDANTGELLFALGV